MGGAGSPHNSVSCYVTIATYNNFDVNLATIAVVYTGLLWAWQWVLATIAVVYTGKS